MSDQSSELVEISKLNGDFKKITAKPLLALAPFCPRRKRFPGWW
jgi:hypothetical protein